jgi:fumarate reductase subunit D
MTESFFRDDAEEKPIGEVPSLEGAAPATPDAESTGGFASDEGRMAAIMAYIPLLCFVPLLSMKENKEARFHARQGVLLFLIELVAVLFLIDAISDLVFKGILIGAVALSVAGIVFAVQGKNYRLPIISDMADKAKL